MLPKNPIIQAMLMFLFSMACFAAMNILIRMLADSMHSTQMVFVRNALSLVFIIALSTYQQQAFPRFTTSRLSGHIGRGMAGLIAMQLWFHSVTIMPVTLVTALSFTTPIFATIFAIIFLGERAGIRRWSALAISFVGMLIILRPDAGMVDAKVFFVLASSAAMAVAGTFVKSLSRTEAPETIVFYMVMVMTPLSLPLALLHWQAISLSQLWILFWIAVLSTLAQLMMARAYKRAEMVVLLPLDFTRLVFTSLFAYVMFGEILDSHAWFGAGIILVSTVYIAHREAVRKKKT